MTQAKPRSTPATRAKTKRRPQWPKTLPVISTGLIHVASSENDSTGTSSLVAQFANAACSRGERVLVRLGISNRT